MNVLETLQYMGDRVQIAVIIGSVPTDGSGDISILYANDPASTLFGYESGGDMVGADVRSLMPPDIARAHQSHVGGYLIQSQAKGGTMMIRAKSGRIMGSWRNLKGVRLDGSSVDLQVNVADIKNNDERYFMAIFRDRTEEVAREKELREAVNSAVLARSEAEDSAKEAIEAKAKAEEALKRQDDLSNQVNLLLTNLTSFRPQTTLETAMPPAGITRRQWFIASCVVGLLMAGAVMLETVEGVPVSLVERVLLVLAGVLGTSAAGVLDLRNKA